MVEIRGFKPTHPAKEYDMPRKFITTVFVCSTILTMTPACAEQDKAAEATAAKAQPSEAIESAAEAATADGATSIMETPVNFSTPEDVEKSIDLVREQAGEAQARELSNALGYILAYDLSLGRDKEKMYKKLNGRTPNEIIAKMKR
jgi:hypothetical protein